MEDIFLRLTDQSDPVMVRLSVGSHRALTRKRKELSPDIKELLQEPNLEIHNDTDEID